MVKIILDAKKFGHNIEELNVGGGLGIRYTESDDPPSIDEWVKTISSSVVGELLAKRAIKKGIKQVIFDRGGNLYHGRVKALADAAREAGLEF